MSAPTPAQVTAWQSRLAAHTLRDGECPVCKVPHRCRVWADAFADLLAHGVLPETTPTPPTGGIPTAGQSEGDNPMTSDPRPLNQWFKSTKSGPNCDNCVEVRFIGGGLVEVRNSRRPDGRVLTFDADEWDAFNGGAAEGEFALPAHAR